MIFTWELTDEYYKIFGFDEVWINYYLCEDNDRDFDVMYGIIDDDDCEDIPF